MTGPHGNPLYALLSVLMFFTQMNNNNRNTPHEIHHGNEYAYFSQAGENDYLNEVAQMALQQKSLEAERIRHYLESPQQPQLFSTALKKSLQRLQRVANVVYPFRYHSNIGRDMVFNTKLASTRDAGQSWYNPTSPGMFIPVSVNNAKVKAAAQFATRVINELEETERFHLAMIVSADKQSIEGHTNFRMQLQLSDKSAHNTYLAVVTEQPNGNLMLSFVSNNKFT